MNERVRGAPVGIGEDGGGVGGRRKDALVNKPRLLRERTMRCGSGARWEWRDVYSSSSPHREPRRAPPPPSHPPGAVPLGSGIRCSDFGAVNPGGGVVEVAGAALMGAV